MQLTTSVLLAFGAGSAMAAPHLRHAQFHEKKAVGDVVHAVIDGVDVSWVNTYDGGASSTPAAPAAAAPAAAAAAPATSNVAAVAAPAASKAAAVTPSTAGATTYKAFCDGNSKRATDYDIKFAGNTGTGGGCAFGSNLMQISSAIADQYDYVTKFTTAGTEDETCDCFNKIGPTGQNDGAWNTVLSFTVPAGGAAYMAAAPGSIGGCSCQAGGSVQKDQFGEVANSLYEFEFGSQKNNDGSAAWSGVDASAIVPGNNMNNQFQGMKVCPSGSSEHCSWFLPGATIGNTATYSNAFLKGMEAENGLGYNTPDSKVSVDVTLSYTG